MRRSRRPREPMLGCFEEACQLEGHTVTGCASRVARIAIRLSIFVRSQLIWACGCRLLEQRRAVAAQPPCCRALLSAHLGLAFSTFGLAQAAALPLPRRCVQPLLF